MCPRCVHCRRGSRQEHEVDYQIGVLDQEGSAELERPEEAPRRWSLAGGAGQHGCQFASCCRGLRSATQGGDRPPMAGKLIAPPPPPSLPAQDCLKAGSLGVVVAESQSLIRFWWSKADVVWCPCAMHVRDGAQDTMPDMQMRFSYGPVELACLLAVAQIPKKLDDSVSHLLNDLKHSKLVCHTFLAHLPQLGHTQVSSVDSQLACFCSAFQLSKAVEALTLHSS